MSSTNPMERVAVIVPVNYVNKFNLVKAST